MKKLIMFIVLSVDVYTGCVFGMRSMSRNAAGWFVETGRVGTSDVSSMPPPAPYLPVSGSLPRRNSGQLPEWRVPDKPIVLVPHWSPTEVVVESQEGSIDRYGFSRPVSGLPMERRRSFASGARQDSLIDPSLLKFSNVKLPVPIAPDYDEESFAYGHAYKNIINPMRSKIVSTTRDIAKLFSKESLEQLNYDNVQEFASRFYGLQDKLDRYYKEKDEKLLEVKEKYRYFSTDTDKEIEDYEKTRYAFCYLFIEAFARKIRQLNNDRLALLKKFNQAGFFSRSEKLVLSSELNAALENQRIYFDVIEDLIKRYNLQEDTSYIYEMLRVHPNELKAIEYNAVNHEFITQDWPIKKETPRVSYKPKVKGRMFDAVNKVMRDISGMKINSLD